MKKARCTTGASYEPGDVVVITVIPYYYGGDRREVLATVTEVIDDDTFYYQELPENWEHEIVNLPGWESATP